LGRQLHRRLREHHVGHHRPEGAAEELGADVASGLPGAHAPEQPVGDGDHRVEVGAGDRAEGEDDGHQGGGGGGRVLEQLQPDVAG
jgi:hypothetical protein